MGVPSWNVKNECYSYQDILERYSLFIFQGWSILAWRSTPTQRKKNSATRSQKKLSQHIRNYDYKLCSNRMTDIRTLLYSKV